MKPVVVAVLVSVCALVFLSVSLGFATHLGYISFEDEPGHVQPSQGSGEPNQQGPILGASVVVPAAVSLSVAAKVAISITVILVLAGLAVGAYFLWQYYQDDIIRLVDPESYNQKLERERLEKEQQEKDALALKEEQERQASADRLWKTKLISLGVSAAVGIILSLVIWVSEDRNENVSKIAKTLYLILFLVIPVLAGAFSQSWSVLFVNMFALIFIVLAMACLSEIHKTEFEVDFSAKLLGVVSISCLVLMLVALFV